MVAGAASWALSLWWHLSMNYYRYWDAGLMHGALVADRFNPPLPIGSRLGGMPADECHIRLFRQDPDPIWLPSWHASGPPVPLMSITVPLWIPTLAAAALGLVAHRRVRRLDRIGRCYRCGYDRAGLAAGSTCPECGAPPA